MGDLDGLVALVTGAGSGIGAATARLLSGRGALVVVADRETAAAEAVVEGLPGESIAVTCDVAIDEDAANMVGSALDAFGRLDIAVNNAGVSNGGAVRIADMALGAWRHTMSVNLDGVFHCLRAELPAMIAGGGGSIVNTASVMGAVGNVLAGGYVASKHGVIGLTKAAALDYALDGIRVNAVCPGFIDTPLLTDASRQNQSALEGMHALNRFGTAEEIAEVIAFVASPAASFVTGAVYAADGGYTAR